MTLSPGRPDRRAPLVRGTCHIRDGNLKDGTGTLVAGGHLIGANSRGSVPSNCERCHQRFAYDEEQAKANPKRPFGSYFESRLPSCGTEGSQAYNTRHKDAAMNCSTCHDPHEVTANDWRGSYTVPGLKKPCEDCHPGQSAFFKNRDTHSQSTCASCHMPVMMSCENFASIQYTDMAGFDTARTSWSDGHLIQTGAYGRYREAWTSAIGEFQTVALSPRLAGKQPLPRLPAPSDPRPPPGTLSTCLSRSA